MKTARPRLKIIRLLLCLAVLFGLAGCADFFYGKSALDEDYGNSVRSNLAQTILNPRAGINDTPAAGLGPNAGVNEMDRYDKSFKGEEKKPSEMKITY